MKKNTVTTVFKIMYNNEIGCGFEQKVVLGNEEYIFPAM